MSDPRASLVRTLSNLMIAHGRAAVDAALVEAETLARARLEPPADAWVRVGDHEWATDRNVLIRRDCVRPDVERRWATGAGEVSEIPNILAALLVENEPHPGVFDARYRPILLAGSPRLTTARPGHKPWWPREITRTAPCAVLDAECNVLALVMPFLDLRAKGVRADGTPAVGVTA